jgi:hypothetical protein
VNVRNAGTLPFLPDDAVIEVPAVIGAGGAEPVAVAPLSPLMRGLVAHVSAYEELAVDAALRGGRHRVAGALLAHPLVGQFDLAGELADRLIAENRATCPGPPAGDAGPLAGDAGPRRGAGHRRREQQDRRGAGGRRRHPAGRRPRPGSNAHIVGLDRAMVDHRGAGRAAARQAGLAAGGAPVAEHVSACLAGADLAEDEERLGAALHAQRHALTCTVVNDTFAILRAGLVPGLIDTGAGRAAGGACSRRACSQPASGRSQRAGSQRAGSQRAGSRPRAVPGSGTGAWP